jgi:tRNA A-37 threonylcarbamoyl transferase component Bud32
VAATDSHAPGPSPEGVAHPLGPGAVFAERYRLVQRLGQGGMAEVYEVEHALTRRHLALKLLRPEVLSNAASVERFYREASVCAGIDSDHIVSVVDCDVDKPTGVPFLVMELLQGKDLAQYLAETTAAGAALPPVLVLQLMKQVASALDKVHAQGIVHRDLKPANLFLTFPSDGPPRVKILDFGIAALVHEDQPASSGKLGTPLYMAPEQLLSGATISGAADLYALALIVYELLVGAPYWEGNTAASLFAKIPDRAARPKPSERALAHNVALPEAFDAWLLRCIDPDPARRPATAGAAVGDLLMVFDPKATQPPRPGALAPAARVGPIAPRAPLGAAPRAPAGGPVRRPLGPPVVPARGASGDLTRRLSPVPARPVAIPSPAPPPPQDAPPTTPPSIPPPPIPPSAVEADEELLTDDIEDLRSTGVVHAAPAPAVVAPRVSAPPPPPPASRAATPPSDPPAPPVATTTERVLDDGLSERATRRIVSRLKAPVAPEAPTQRLSPVTAPEALTQRLAPASRADEAMTQRLVPVIPPPSSEPEEIILAASRPAAPLFGDRTARAGTPAFVTAPAASSAVFDDDTALSRPEEIRFGDSTAPGLGDVPAELPTPPPQPAASYDATGDDAEPYAPQAPYASSEPYAPEAPYSAPEEAPATPADASPPEAQPTASEGLSAKVDAAMSDAAPRVRRRIPRSVELASTAILPTAPPPRTVRSSTLGLATVGTVLLAALAGWVLLRDNPRRPAAAPDAWHAPSATEQSALGRSAQGLAATLRGRRSTRGFGRTSDPATATGMDTGRGLAALLGAHRAGHGAMTPQDQLDTLVALDRLRGDRGWSELRDGAPVPSAQATAWAALAYASMSELTQAETARVRVRVARDALLRSQTDDGGFPLAADGPTHPESTVLATWALVMAEPQDPTAAATVRAATRRALVRVRALLDAPPAEGWTPRHEALAVLSLARARAALRLADASDDARFARFARGLVTRCALPATGNARCAAAADAPAPRPAWWPWSMTATAVLLRGESLSLDPATRQSLGAMVRAELAALDGDLAAWQAMPTPELAEALLALSEMTL